MQQVDGRFRWDMMGKADFSRAAGLVASLPLDIRLQLNASEQGVLTRLLFLCWHHAVHSGRGSAFAIPSQSYLARCIGRTDRTVRRALSALWEMGLVDVQRRSPKGATFFTNIYSLGKRLLAVVYASAGKKVKQNQRRTLLSDNNLKKGIEDAREYAVPSPGESSREKILALLALKRPDGAQSAAQTEEKADPSIAERKEMLKKQAEMLKARGL